MASVIQNNFRVRKNYAKITRSSIFANLIDIQKQSYEKFLQKDIPADQREDVGLQGVFKSVFPIKDFSETSSLELCRYNLDKRSTTWMSAVSAHDLRRDRSRWSSAGRLGHETKETARSRFATSREQEVYSARSRS